MTNLLLSALAGLTGLGSALAFVVGNLGSRHGGEVEGLAKAPPSGSDSSDTDRSSRCNGTAGGLRVRLEPKRRRRDLVRSEATLDGPGGADDAQNDLLAAAPGIVSGFVGRWSYVAHGFGRVSRLIQLVPVNLAECLVARSDAPCSCRNGRLFMRCERGKSSHSSSEHLQQAKHHLE
jgi:hypothetical protein